jgi:hypothetical protein
MKCQEGAASEGSCHVDARGGIGAALGAVNNSFPLPDLESTMASHLVNIICLRSSVEVYPDTNRRINTNTDSELNNIAMKITAVSIVLLPNFANRIIKNETHGRISK